MLNKIKSLLGAVRPAEPALAAERIQVATCALLLEMAHTDSDFQEAEDVLIRDLLQQKFALSPEAASELMEYAHIERAESLDLYHFAREINQNFSLSEKLEVMEGLWRVVYADGILDKYEDALVRQLATLLRLSHRQMIDAKLKVLAEAQGNS